MRRGIKIRLLSAFLLVSCVAMVITGTYAAYLLKQQYLSKTLDYMKRQAITLEPLAASALTDPDRSTMVQTEVARMGLSGGIRITVISVDGTVLADSNENPNLMENHSDRPEFVDALTHGSGYSTRWSETLRKNMMYVAIPVRSSAHPDKILGAVRVSLPMTTVQQETRELWPSLFVVIGVSLGIAALLAYSESRRIAGPIESMSQLAKNMAGGKFHEHFFPRTGTELDTLASSLNTLATTLGARLEDLERSNAKLRAVLDSSISGMVIVGPDGAITAVNEAAGSLLGRPKNQLEQRPYSAALRNRDLAALVYNALYRDEKGRAEIRLTGDEDRIVDAAAVPLPNPSREKPSKGAVLVLHDLTDMRKLETVRNDFVQNVSHELRTPVTVVRGFAETLRDTPPSDAKTHREMADLIYREASRLSDLVEKLLDLAKIESGYLVPKREAVDPATLLKDISAKFEPLTRERKQLVFINVPLEPKLAFYADPSLLDMIFTNLVSNAVKYAGQSARIDIGYREERSQIVAWVKDDGPGISQDDLGRIFERFYRGSKDRSRSTGGSGLGLSIVKHCVSLENGRVWAESEGGHGAAFFVSLPGFSTQTAR